MLLNCDLGESFGHWSLGQDDKIMPYIDMANIACGFHASDPLTMQKTISLAIKHNVSIGAHPGYPDLVGFGRRSMHMSEDELISLIQVQIGALQALCQAQGSQVNYVKPHGALYNDMMKNLTIFTHICQAITTLDNKLPLVIQAIPDISAYETIAQRYDITLQFEGFADRNYQDDGRLVPREQPNAVISNIEDIKTRCEYLKNHKTLLSINNIPLTLKVDTLCIHGDTPNAVPIAEMLRTLFHTIR